MFLAGDIGGTKTNLAIYVYENDLLVPKKISAYPSQGHASLAEMVRHFLSDGYSKVRQACFGVAGPVKGGVVQVTNLPWTVDAAALQAELNFQKVSLLNDLEANAYGINTLLSEELLSLNPQADRSQVGNRALISAGTGLGEAGLLWDGVTHRPFASEGGHASFAPNDSTGDELLIFLRKEHGHVSWERVLSGMGMKNLYHFFRQRSGVAEPDWLSAQLRDGDLGAVVTQAGLAGKDPVCVEALDCFTRNYGAEAGNLALKMLALGGVYIGGGIAQKMLPKMGSSLFLDAFYHKGRMSPLLQSMPVYVILNDKTALRGAAWYAAHVA
ncbi:MAG: glucokinase [Methylacidiphilales bacterium]|nr:glucokinase [Candidatus Methylacidiphilales bacterium]